MNRNEKAIAICQDVLEHLQETRIGHGGYLYGSGLEIPPDARDLQEVLPELQEKCQVCLLGACLLSKIRLYDQAPLGLLDRVGMREMVSINQWAMDSQLHGIFDDTTLAYMESAFEMTPFRRNKDTDFTEAECLGACVFGARFVDPRKRARAIVEAVIEQGGKWRPQPADVKEWLVAMNRFHERKAQQEVVA